MDSMYDNLLELVTALLFARYFHIFFVRPASCNNWHGVCFISSFILIIKIQIGDSSDQMDSRKTIAISFLFTLNQFSILFLRDSKKVHI